MQKKIWVALGLVLVMASGCNDDGSGGGSKSNTGAAGGSDATQVNGQGQTPTTDKTDYTACDEGRPGSDIRGNWKQTFQSGDLQFTLEMRIEDGSIMLTNTCELQGHVLQTSAESPVSFDRETLTIQATDAGHREINDGDFHMNCDVSLKPATSNYSFRGSCLVFAKDGQEQVLVPAD